MKKIIKFISIALVLPLVLTSCLKDKELIGPDADGAVANVIEFGDLGVPASSETSSIPLYTMAFDVAPTGVLNLKLKCVGAKKAESDIKVTIAVDNSLIAKYNEENETEYAELSSSVYSFSSTEVTIKKGEREAILPLNLKPDQFQFDEDYALGLTIKTVSSGVISGNFGNMVVNIGAKNAIDGIYTVAGTASDNVVTTNVGLYPKNISLQTNGANSVLYFDNTYGVNGTIFRTAAGSATNYGNWCPIFVFDSSGKITSVKNAYGTASQNSQGRDGQLDPTGVNKVTFGSDGKVQKIEVSYFMTQMGAVRLSFKEVYTYSKAR
ncbi:DUF1735 domain-containing protein [Sphingobacterium sp. UME9]|uniref:DUF1735 domain-containing protein n=1 Tax=Sphingobacterium sp. UME9 TaxID=1862316 RepID=UPI0016000D04|nr:DUF1735 domain-containing protein [Sphingobacterium sp. UME9]MBB1645160.1 hypothetical protein [Sphingobacterium sp. UME9]